MMRAPTWLTLFVSLMSLAMAGCGHAGPPNGPAPVGVGVPNPAWAVPAWFVDNANSAGCATDQNTCTSATCAAGNVGPCSTYAEIIARWGWPTASPVIEQATRVTFLSDDTEPAFDVTPSIVNGGSFTVTGTLTVAASGTVGTVTAKNRSAPQLLTANLGQSVASFVGLIFSDTTRSSYAWLDSASSGNVATLSQPMSRITDCTGFASELDTVQSGDAYQILRPSKVPIRRFDPALQANVFGGAGSTACLEHVWVPDPSGTIGNSAFDFNLSAVVDEARVDPGGFVRNTRMNQEPIYGFNDFWNGGLNAPMTSQNSLGVIGGDVLSSENPNVTNNGSFILDGDVIAHGFWVDANVGGVVAAAYLKGAFLIFNATVQVEANVGPAAVWGPGSVDVGPGSRLLLEGATATASLLFKGGITFGWVGTVTTGSAYDTSSNPAVWRPGRSLTAANIDATVASGGFGGAAIDPAMQSAIISVQQ